MQFDTVTEQLPRHAQKRLEIDCFALQCLPCRKEQACAHGFVTFHVRGLEQAPTKKLGKASRVASIRLVEPRRQSRMRVPRIEADHGESQSA
jgi:hypothetical protein